MGCGFVKGSCYNWLWSSETDNYNREGGGGGERGTNILPFCRRSDVGQEGCVDQRRGVGVCIIKTYPARLPEQFQVCKCICGLCEEGGQSVSLSVQCSI